MLTIGLTVLLAASPQASDRTVPVAGTEVAVRCVGSRAAGQPLVVLEAGGGNGLSIWSRVQDPIGDFARVCAYDRPTLIRPRGSPPRVIFAPDDYARTLRVVLSRLGEPPPYILVGHSLGGMIVRLYAAAYPTEVVGMVLVDSSHEDQLTRFEAIDPQVAKELRAPGGDESVDLDALSAALNRNRWRSTIPLVVLTHGKVPRAPAGREAQVDAIEKAWLDMQRELATRSSAGKHIVAAQSGHYIQMEQPALVIDAVRQMIHRSDGVGWLVRQFRGRPPCR